MNKNKTHISMVVDRSGSMYSIKNDAEGGINTLIAEQKKIGGECTLVLSEFDDKFNNIFAGNIQSFNGYTLTPRGSTALYDAVCKEIIDTGKLLAAIPENDRPALVIFVIVTDGHENASIEFTYKHMQDMIKEQTEVYNWQFTFLCTDPTVQKIAKSAGILSSELYSQDNTFDAYLATSSKFSRMRGMSASGQSVDNSYTKGEIQSMTKNKIT